MKNFSIIQKSKLEGAMRLDAEYYQPEYLDVLSKISNYPTLFDLARNIICGPFGSAILNSDYKESGLPLLRVNNLNNDFVSTEDLVFIKEKLGDKLKRYQVSSGDIVVSQRGTIAMFSLVSDDYKKYNISANLISILKSDKINFLYLLAFLNGKYGNIQLIRRVSGQVQPKITTDDIKEIKVFLPEQKKQENVAIIIINSQKELKNSKLLYQQAEELLLKELDLEKFNVEENLSTVVNFANVLEARRIDAEYFQEKYFEVISKIENYSEGRDFVKNQFKQNKNILKKDKEHYNYIEIGNINIGSGEIKYSKIKTKDLPANGKISLFENDLLISKVRPYRGAVSYIDFKIDNLLGSGAFTVLQEKGDYRKEVLMVFLKTKPIKDLLMRYNCGTSYPVIKDEDILNLKIPLIRKETQQKISDLVRQSYEARKKAKDLLEEAKRKVEEMIEKGE